jgi:hypothetical protein
LSQSIQTAHYVNHLARNVPLTLISQEAIDKKIQTRFEALESVVVLLGDEVQAIKTHLSLCCHSSYQWIHVTAKPYNEYQWSWEHIKQHLKGVWSHTNLSLDLVVLHQEILDIQNSNLPIIQPSDVVAWVLDTLKGFNPFNILRHSFWIMLGMPFLILLILCLFLVICYIGMYQLFKLKADFTTFN